MPTDSQDPERPPHPLSRREFTRSALSVAGVAGTAGLAGLAACVRGGGPGDDDDSSPGGGDDDDATSPPGDDDDSAASQWASGGTGSMSGDYPDPFVGDDATSCALYCATTLGPCYAETLVRRDVSEGAPGVPTRLALRIVDADCNPIPGAEVDIWHTHPKGVYSGEDAAAMCTTGDEEAEASRWFRGVQTTDANGRVDFDTCFPGWYAGRAIHIHVQVRLGGEAFVTSQIFFDQALINEIFASHPDYSKYGAPDTPNAEDNIMNALGGPSSICQHARMEDGALQAWITLAIRSSLDEGLCD